MFLYKHYLDPLNISKCLHVNKLQINIDNLVNDIKSLRVNEVHGSMSHSVNEIDFLWVNKVYGGKWSTSQRSQRGLWSLWGPPGQRVHGSMRSTRSTVDSQCFHFTHELCHCLYFQQRNSWNIRILNNIRKIYKINPELSAIFWYIIQIFGSNW